MRSSPGRGTPNSAPPVFLVEDRWKLVQVEPEVVEVQANGTNGNFHHDESAKPQQKPSHHPSGLTGLRATVQRQFCLPST